VFFVNVPALIPTIIGCLLFVPRDRARRLDWFGFATLNLGVGALQLMLNRGERHDWFASTEIVIEAAVATLCLYTFLVHTLTARDPFVRPDAFKDRNYSLGLLFVFIFAFVLQSPIVLLSLFFQHLGGYPVETVGLLLTPRGAGAFLSMMLAGPLIAWIDPRLIMTSGFLCFMASYWLIAGWTADVSPWVVAWVGILQGFGSGFVWVPLSTLAVATLASRGRDEAIGFFHLLFNVGASIGIVVTIIVALRTAVVNHAELTESVTVFSEMYRAPFLPGLWTTASPSGLAALEHEIARQADMIGYTNGFVLLALFSVALIPLTYLFARPRARLARDSSPLGG